MHLFEQNVICILLSFPALDGHETRPRWMHDGINWLNKFNKTFIKRLIRKMTNWPTSWKVIFGDHATQQANYFIRANRAPKTWKIDSRRFVWSGEWEANLLFIHISKSINLNMRFRAAPEKLFPLYWQFIFHWRKKKTSIWFIDFVCSKTESLFKSKRNVVLDG